MPVRDLPKVLLHDHLDGGLRPGTMVELAREVGYRRLPSRDPDDLATMLHQGRSGSLDSYLAAFAHTVAVMQTPEALRRIAYEAVEDLAADGVVYAELRFAPSLHTRRGMRRSAVIRAVIDGIHDAMAITGIDVRLIVDAMRQGDDAADVVSAAIRFRERGVVGFDLAGPEAGYPPTRHLEACRAAASAGLHLTIHAGEADGPRSVALAIDPCGAERIGHGVRIVEDLDVRDGVVVAVGDIAATVRDRAVPLEVCPTSNVHTRAFPSHESHPLGLLYRSGFAVTINTDNRLMSGIALSDELEAAVRYHGFDRADLRVVTLRAVDAAFCEPDVRRRVRTRVEDGFGSA
jgi:adenosine deaminase